jgi:hypothetical protein
LALAGPLLDITIAHILPGTCFLRVAFIAGRVPPIGFGLDRADQRKTQRAVAAAPDREAKAGQTLKLSPQPQLDFTFGLLNLKAAFKPSRV